MEGLQDPKELSSTSSKVPDSNANDHSISLNHLCKGGPVVNAEKAPSKVGSNLSNGNNQLKEVRPNDNVSNQMNLKNTLHQPTSLKVSSNFDVVHPQKAKANHPSTRFSIRDKGV